jgi:hypothetical protein
MGDPALVMLVRGGAQYQPVDCECDHAPQGEPYRLSM